jgi:hypothetical protein
MVHGGVMSPEQVIKDLEWIVPGDHHWDLVKVDDHTYHALFPHYSWFI